MVSQQGVFGEPGYDCMLGKELWKREAGPSVLTGEEPRRRGRSTLLSDSSWRESLQKHMCALALRGGGEVRMTHEQLSIPAALFPTQRWFPGFRRFPPSRNAHLPPHPTIAAHTPPSLPPSYLPLPR